jgi:uncharacterized protein YtpQ (UPF0354 family)
MKEIPKADFTRQHYQAIQFVLRDLNTLSEGDKRNVVLHFDFYFRQTQEGYNAKKFIEGCYKAPEKSAVQAVDPRD